MPSRLQACKLESKIILKMAVNQSNSWRTRSVTFVFAALAAASASYWALKWPTPSPATRTSAAEPTSPPIDTTKVAQLLGANPAAASSGAPVASVAVAAKYKLMGVIAQGQHSGSALIAIEGQPAKPYRVGEPVGDDLVLQSVKARSATLGASAQGTGSVTLELPPLAGAP